MSEHVVDSLLREEANKRYCEFLRQLAPFGSPAMSTKSAIRNHVANKQNEEVLLLINEEGE